MSLYGMMRTGASGMEAQVNRLSTVGENIANANTTGYKKASTEFSSLILPTSGSSYNSGAVDSKTRYGISQQGSTVTSTSKTDLAINGNGFFVVSDNNGTNFLTRAGGFVQNNVGELVNTAGFKLMGYKYVEGVDPVQTVNGFGGMEPINLASTGLSAKASTKGTMAANLPSGDAVGQGYTTSLSIFDTQGNARLMDFNYKKTGTNTWTLEVKDRTTGNDMLSPATNTMTFDSATGKLLTGGSITLVGSVLGTPIAGSGAQVENIVVDLSKTTQLGFKFSPDGGTVDGNAPSRIKDVTISSDGVVSVTYENNKIEPRYRIGMANVQSPDNLTPQVGNVYSQSIDSGVIVTGFANIGNFGAIMSGALEASNVDLAGELTDMISSQRSYTANSKVFQTGSDLLDILVNLKR
ncbi:flagellar hook protein FlgE [Xaviernesmea oryzae]|uniref:Flagellar hook protein FlgE n=1 Tax=Xaviernesmea oryzae TaxID=464029 RepID=A0A1Q9AS09_9HYPH|nr:flagellar hook protein FlgE [Xaviernesmea oryzae]OLP58168.1 flagellar hook protein FlgE [Xaviernesmea oryzae]SEL80302.1 flagellar hook protein FlgE [Xaviernesmea oryzae]